MLETYIPPVPEELRKRFELELDRVMRWKGVPFPVLVTESSLAHTQELMRDVAVFESDQNFIGELNFDDVKFMTWGHEVGEIMTRDLAISRADYEQVREKHKRREHFAAKWLIRNGIKDPDTCERALGLMARYEACAQDDKEVLFIHLLDKAQAIRFGLVNVYNGRLVDQLEGVRHVVRALDLVHDYFAPLRQSLGERAKTSLDAFMIEQINQVQENGYPGLAVIARSKFFGKIGG